MVHPLAAHFGSAADLYERGRPGYPPEVAAELAADLGLDAGDRVLDLGAGTGKLTRALLGLSLAVTAVEPSPGMRARLEREAPGARILDGLAEKIPLGDESVEAVTVADAFHWFDAGPALAEIRRVLAPGGTLASLNVLPDWSGFAAGAPLGELIAGIRPEHPYFDGPSWAEIVRRQPGWSEPRELTLSGVWPASPESLVAYVGSISFVAGMPEADRARRLDEVAGLLEHEQVPAEMPVTYRVGVAERD